MDLTTAIQIPINGIAKETEKAWQIILDTGEIIWFPKSQCRIVDGVLFVPEWIAKEKGISK